MPRFLETHGPALKIHIHSEKILSIHINLMNIKTNHVAEIGPSSFCFKNFYCFIIFNSGQCSSHSLFALLKWSIIKIHLLGLIFVLFKKLTELWSLLPSFPLTTIRPSLLFVPKKKAFPSIRSSNLTDLLLYKLPLMSVWLQVLSISGSQNMHFFRYFIKYRDMFLIHNLYAESLPQVLFWVVSGTTHGYMVFPPSSHWASIVPQTCKLHIKLSHNIRPQVLVDSPSKLWFSCF